MPLDPIPPEPGRRWPPEHCWMDENGDWWEAPGKRWVMPSAAECKITHNAVFGNGDTSLYGISHGSTQDVVIENCIEFVSVPRNPTPAMLEAAWADALAEDAAGVWRSMIDAWLQRKT